MRNNLNTVVRIVQLICFIPMGIFVILLSFKEIVGKQALVEILEKLPFELTYNQVMITGYIFSIVMLISFVIRAKLFKEKK